MGSRVRFIRRATRSSHAKPRSATLFHATAKLSRFKVSVLGTLYVQLPCSTPRVLFLSHWGRGRIELRHAWHGSAFNASIAIFPNFRANAKISKTTHGLNLIPEAQEWSWGDS